MISDLHPLRAILFDLVGVLFFPKLGTPFDDTLDQIDAAIGQVTDDGAFKAWLAHHFGLEGASLGQAMRSVTECYAPYLPLWDLLPALRQSYRLGIINNGTYLTYPYFDAAYTLGQRFDAFVSSAIEGIKKPDPAIYLRACQKLGVSPAACLFMDDDPGNVAGARQAGMQAIHWETRESGFQQFMEFVRQSGGSIQPIKEATMETSPDLIYHIASRTDWEAALATGSYRADSLASQGFIHASTQAQVLRTANRYYYGQRGLLLLSIDPSRVTAEIRYESAEGSQERFPHIYGPLALDAVVSVQAFEPEPDGAFLHW